MLNVTLVLLAALFVALAVAVAAEAAVYGGVNATSVFPQDLRTES